MQHPKRLNDIFVKLIQLGSWLRRTIPFKTGPFNTSATSKSRSCPFS